MKKSLISLVFLAFAITIFPQVAFAGTLNSDSADFDTLRVGNVTQNPNTTSASWGTSVYANPGDVLSFAIYYHNTSSETINNVRIKLSPKTTGISDSHEFSAVVWGDNTSPVYGKVVVNLNTPSKLEYVNNSVKWRPNQQVYGSNSLPNNQSGNHIFNLNGISLGSISPGWATQGNVMIGFSVPQNQYVDPTPTPNPNEYVTAQTLSAGNIEKTNALVRGSVISSYGSSNAWFEWGSTVSLGNKTSNLFVSATNSLKQVSASIYGLNQDTIYYYRLVAQNGSDISYGEIKFFKTTGNGYVNPNPTPVYENKISNIDIEKTVKNTINPNGTRVETTAKRGDIVRFTIKIENTGDYDLKNIEIRDALDDSFRLVNGLDKDSDRENSRKVVWLIDDLDVGEEKEVFFEALVAEDAKIGSILENGGNKTVVETGSLLRTSNKVYVEVVDKVQATAALALSGVKLALSFLIFLLTVIVIFVLYKVFNK